MLIRRAHPLARSHLRVVFIDKGKESGDRAKPQCIGARKDTIAIDHQGDQIDGFQLAKVTK